jgi:beta-lactamase class A
MFKHGHRPLTIATASASAGLAALAVGLMAQPHLTPSAAAAGRGPVDPPALTALERSADARVGVYAIDTGTGRVVAHRATERFPFASTGKILSAGLTLRHATDAQLDQVTRWTQPEVLDYAPVTNDFVTSGLALRHLINAELEWSDNTAANVVVRELGGVGAVQASLSEFGDRVTRVDRLEPDLNTAIPGDLRDTSTPQQIAADLRALLLGPMLTPRRRALMRTFMESSTTGDRLIRAAVPSSWTVADKTGSASYGTRNDVAVVQPPRGAPIVISIDTTHAQPAAATDDALVADAARVALQALGVR